MHWLVTALVLAYVMPTFSVLRRVAGVRDDVSVPAVRAEGAAAVAPFIARPVADALGVPWSSGELPLTAVLSVRYPGRCRLDLSPPGGGPSITAVRTQGQGAHRGPPLEAADVLVEELCAVVALRSVDEGATRDALERHLDELDVSIRDIALARFGGAVAYQVGERTPGAAQFWVYKDRFQPARVIRSAARGGWDVRFIDYTAPATGDWLPRTVEVYQGPELHLRVTLLAANGRVKPESLAF